MKKKLVILSAAAMVAAAAVPALAFENEFHGMYRLRANVTNFETAGLAGFEGDGKTKGNALYAEDNRTFTTFEQRARIQYIAKASDDLKLVTHFEIDSSWGDAAQTTGRGSGAGAGADSTNIETKNVYLDFNLPSTPVNMKVGLQGWTDAYKGIIYSNDMAGVNATAKLDALTLSGAFFRMYDAGGGTNTWGKKNVDLYVLDGKFALNKDTTLGASYYLANNDNTSTGADPAPTTDSPNIGNENAQTHMLGVNAATKLGILDLSGFVMYQTGDALYDFQEVNGKTKDLSAWAAEIAAKANLGMATVRGSLLYTSGDDNNRENSDESSAFQVLQENNNLAATGYMTGNGGSYYSSNMMLLFRNSFAMDSDIAVVGNMNNTNHGVMGAFLGTDVKVNDKFSVSANLGSAWTAEKQKYGIEKEKEDYIGTEVNLSLNYKLYPTLTATLQGAYVMLGDVFDDSIETANGDLKDPENPYLAGLMLNYTF